MPKESAALFGPEDDALTQALDVQRHNRESVYSHPGFTPVRKEHSQVPVKVVGTLPADLQGVYLRNGTNVQFDTPTVRSHAFNGAGMLHQVQFRGGQASYSNTYVRTPRYEFEQKAGREVFPSYGDMASSGTHGLARMKLVARKQAEGLIPKWSALEANPASTSIQYHHGELYCLQGSGLPFVLNAKVEGGLLHLDGTGRIEDFGGALKVPFSAHPRIDPVTGDFYSVCLDSRGRALWLVQLHEGRLANCVKVHSFDEGAALTGTIHDYFLTEHYIVIADVSLRFSESHVQGDSQGFWRFDPSHRLRWGVLPRDFKAGDSVRWFETANPAMVWHMVNAWEEGAGDDGRIVLHAPAFDRYPSNVPIHTPEEPPAYLTRWELDLATGAVSEQRLLEHGYERPSINVAWVGRRSRHAWLLDEEADGYMGKGVLKYDLLAQKEAAYVDYGRFHGGEALFVPRAGAGTGDDAEDDGYLLDLLMAGDDAQLLVLDARTMKELARVILPARVPFGVHACWLDEPKLLAMQAVSASRSPAFP